ncbi:TerD family protein [Streptomyces tropicalis]|uniref:TerD family protein n=1 Tax=Streptomyces tropicalis TaxID=3034234 RepID=A0ABT6ABG0_9ACTN|nr:TerD family protein [Streptomyces tropicalis]MDF3301990.1 TerD family protein [Streptomyces tropicalis]
MTAELVRGQNHPLPEVRLGIRVSAGTPVVAAVSLGDDRGRAHLPECVAHPGAPVLPGVEVTRQAAADHLLTVDLEAVHESVHRVSVLLVLPAGGAHPARFGAVAAPRVAVSRPDGTELAGYTVTGLDSEAAVVALEFYRRQGTWKVRAVGQGYAGGLAALLTDQGLPGAAALATAVEAAASPDATRAAPAPARPPAEDRRSARPATAPSGAGHGDAATAHGPGTARPASADAGRTTAGHGRPAHPKPPSDTGTSRPPDPDDTRGTSGSSATPSAPVPAASPAPSPPEPEASAPAPGQPPAARPRASGAGPVDCTHPSRRPAAPPAPSGQPAQPVAGDATGWSMEERLYNQVRGMFEDLARTTAAYRSAVDFADDRRDQELDQVLSDPRNRIDGAGDAARDAVRARHAELVDRAGEVFDRDLAQLAAESEVVEPALPPAYARWDYPVWHGYRVPTQTPMAVRLGDLHLPESPSLRIPLLIRLPLERGLWIDSGPSATDADSAADDAGTRRRAVDVAVAVAARLLAIHPAGEFDVHVVDPAGSAAQALVPLVQAGVLTGPPALGAAGVTEVLSRLTERVDLVQMAVRGGAPDALPAGLGASRQLLIVNGFPHGFDDRAVTRLRYLADEGPAAGVHLMLVAAREDASAYGPLLDPLWRALLRLTPLPDDHLADPWVGHAWTYEPSLVPPGSAVLHLVLSRLAKARRHGSR